MSHPTPTIQQPRMTLREYFAGLAMSAYLANTKSVEHVDSILSTMNNYAMDISQLLAVMAVEQADALIAELAKTAPNELD